MKCNIKIFLAFLCSILIAGTPFGSMAADKIPAPPSILGITSETVSPTPAPTPVPPPPAPVIPAGNDGLLSGMTPGSYKIPSGWSLVRTQDFEGSQPADELWSVSWGAAATTERPHSGSKSLMRNYTAGQNTLYWALDVGHLGGFTEVYLSFYEYTESQTLFNDEYWVGRFGAAGSTFQEIIIDWLWAKNASGNPSYNGPRATLYAIPQGQRSRLIAAHSDYVPKGSWVQWEVHYRPNTPADPNSDAGDGFIRIYKNGSLYTSAENVNLNGKIDMTNMSVQAGGLYNRDTWYRDYPTCSVQAPAPGTGTDYCTNPRGWDSLPFSSTIPGPALPSFKRYLDDIIVMKK